MCGVAGSVQVTRVWGVSITCSVGQGVFKQGMEDAACYGTDSDFMVLPIFVVFFILLFSVFRLLSSHVLPLLFSAPSFSFFSFFSPL